MESTCAATFSNRALDDWLTETSHIGWTSSTGIGVYGLHSKVLLDLPDELCEKIDFFSQKGGQGRSVGLKCPASRFASPYQNASLVRHPSRCCQLLKDGGGSECQRYLNGKVTTK